MGNNVIMLPTKVGFVMTVLGL